MPQFKPGWFAWKFLRADADTVDVMRVVLLEERDPSRAARFATEEGALAFLERLDARAKAFWAERAAAEARTREGVQIKRVVR